MLTVYLFTAQARTRMPLAYQSMTLPANEIKIVKDSINDKIENIIVNYIASGTPIDSFTNELENEVKKARDHIQ